MNRIVLVLLIFGLIAVISPMINSITGSSVIDLEIECPDGLAINYYYSPSCHACQSTTPLIDDLIENGCQINKVDIKENYELAIINNIQYTPTLIIGGDRIVGGFSLVEVKDLIDSQL